jgi:hypothetical protein
VMANTTAQARLKLIRVYSVEFWHIGQIRFGFTALNPLGDIWHRNLPTTLTSHGQLLLRE